jgi:prepilin-type processing-associated H-X9-DG protein
MSVIAVLAGLLLPALGRARNKALAIDCLNNQRQLSLACLIYAADFQDRLPYNKGEAEIRKDSSQGRFVNWTSSVMSWELDADNTNSALLTRGGIGPYAGHSPRIYRCPSDRALSDIQAAAGWTERVRSMSMNAMAGDAGQFSQEGKNVNNPDYTQFFTLAEVPRPANIFLLIEEHPDSINDGYFLNRIYSREWTDLPASYHDGAATLAFIDGHSELHSWRFPSTKPPPKPDAARLPFAPPDGEAEDFEWLMDHTTVEVQ